MKRFASLFVVALVIALGAGGASAKPDKPGKAEKAGKADKGTGIKGVVTEVSGNNIVVQSKGKKGAAITIATDANTKFSGSATSLAGIKPGMHVTASPVSGTAQQITVSAGKEGGKKNKGEKKKDK